MQVREVVFIGGGRAEMRMSERPLDPGPRQIALRTLYSFVSTGTERAKLTGLQKIDYPWVAGNRAVAEVIGIGAEVKDVRVGDRVLVHTPHASHVLTDAFRAVVPDGVPLPQAAASAIALVAMTALRVSPPQLGDTVVVVGLGPVGMIAAQLYMAAGVVVVGVDRDPARLALARELGISHQVQAGGGDVVAAVRAHTGEDGARIVIEATGVPSVVPLCFDFARQGGELVFLGSPRGTEMMDVTPLLERMHLWRPHSSVTVKGAHEWQFPAYKSVFNRHSMEENAAAIFSLILRGRLDLSRVIDHVVPAAEAPGAYASLLAEPGKWSGILFDWSGA
jgi:2-desacetyl-2-hydroxyethyl bacteriochlorophyllide A dehydrogenase